MSCITFRNLPCHGVRRVAGISFDVTVVKIWNSFVSASRYVEYLNAQHSYKMRSFSKAEHYKLGDSRKKRLKDS